MFADEDSYCLPVDAEMPPDSRLRHPAQEHVRYFCFMPCKPYARGLAMPPPENSTLGFLSGESFLCPPAYKAAFNFSG
jgi:hypothetical protein